MRGSDVAHTFSPLKGPDLSQLNELRCHGGAAWRRPGSAVNQPVCNGLHGVSGATRVLASVRDASAKERRRSGVFIGGRSVTPTRGGIDAGLLMAAGNLC